MAAVWGVLSALLSRLISSQLGRWILSALAWLGITWATQQVATGPVLSELQGYFSGLGSEALFWVAFFNLDKAITMILGAYTTRASIAGAKVFLAKRATA